MKTSGQHKTSVDLSGQSRDGNVTACSIILAISSNPPWLSMWNIFISSCAVRIWVEEWLLLTCVSLCAMVYGNHLATYSTIQISHKISAWFCCAFLACSRACASKVFSLRADCGRVIVYPGLKQWERPRHNIFGVCTRLAGGVCMSTSANSSASKHLTVTKIVWKIVYVTFDYLISHFFKILSLEFMANLFRDFRASVSLKVFHYRLRGKWCQYDLEIN